MTADEAEAAVEEARAAFRDGDSARAEALLGQALAAYDDDGDAGRAIGVLTTLAFVADDRGNLREALRLLREEALPRAIAIADEQAVIPLLAQIGALLHQLDDHEGALRVRRDELLPMAERVGQPRMLCYAYIDLASTHAAMGAKKEAIRLLETMALPMTLDLEDREVTIDILGFLQALKPPEAAATPENEAPADGPAPAKA